MAEKEAEVRGGAPTCPEPNEDGGQMGKVIWPEAWETNIKGVTDSNVANMLAISTQLARASERTQQRQDDWHVFQLETARQANAAVQRLINDGVSLSARINNDAWTHSQGMYVAGLTQAAGQSSIAAQMAQEAQEAATAAVNAALGNTAATSAPSQGTTGVAQGGMQTGQSAVNTALLTRLANVETALHDLLVEIVGNVVEEEPEEAKG